jgi:hypothetical protein
MQTYVNGQELQQEASSPSIGTYKTFPKCIFGRTSQTMEGTFSRPCLGCVLGPEVLNIQGENVD